MQVYDGKLDLLEQCVPMKSNPLSRIILIACLTGISTTMPCLAEHGFVVVLVQDTQHRPVRRVEIGIEGIGGSKLTGDDGKAQLAVGSGRRSAIGFP